MSVDLLEAKDYQPRARELFERLRAALGPRLPSARIEHVGASAIPGALSKGDLDVCVVVAAHDFDAALATLHGAGFREKADTLRTPQLCMLVADRPDVDLAVQLVERDSKFEFFMAFRDALRGRPELVAEYNQIKQTAAAAGQDAYRAAKSAFIERVLSDARGG